MAGVLTIQRSKWLRGDAMDSSLLRDDGKMCCLGFDALACGLAKADILGEISPTYVADEVFDLPENYKAGRLDDSGRNTDAVRLAMKHNDDPELDEDVRETLIREDLKALGWDDVLFVD